MKAVENLRPGGVWILGGTSSVAREVARELARRGHPIVLGGRDIEELERSARDLSVRYGIEAAAVEFDALAFDRHPSALEAAARAVGGNLEGVVFSVGYLGRQALAQDDFTEARRILDTNFTSAVSVLNLAANRLERRGSGFICVLSSVAGDRGRQSNYIYGSAKGGLSTYLQGLRNRLHRAGVRVITVKPGFMDTGMTYGQEGMFLVAAPGVVARGIARAIDQGTAVVYLPRFWWGVMALIRAIPERIFKRMKL